MINMFTLHIEKQNGREILFVKENVTIFGDFHKISSIFSKFCLITQKCARSKLFFTQIDKEVYFAQIPLFIIIAFHSCF